MVAKRLTVAQAMRQRQYTPDCAWDWRASAHASDVAALRCSLHPPPPFSRGRPLARPPSRPPARPPARTRMGMSGCQPPLTNTKSLLEKVPLTPAGGSKRGEEAKVAEAVAGKRARHACSERARGALHACP